MAVESLRYSFNNFLNSPRI